MTPQLRFSVITPSFNQGHFIEQTIQSVLGQRYANLEHIVIDGGSTDDTIEIFRRYPHLKWLSEKDNGQSDALNKGFRMASGDIIAWINSDDWYEEGVFQIIAAFFQRYPERNVVMGNCNLVDESGNVFDKVINYERGFDELKKHWVARSIPTQPAIFFRRELLDRYGLLDESLHYAMDYDLWMRFAPHNTFYHIDLTVANYRFHPSAKGGDQDWNKFIPDCVKVYNRYCTPIVSVIIPCYNYAHFLPEAVSSVINQTFQAFEILVVNDGSSDNTIEIATKLIEFYHPYPIKLINQPNSGHPAHTRNRGISEAIGAYILPLDADDKLHPFCLESLVDALEESSTYDIAYCDTVRFGDENISYSNPDWDPDLLLSHNYLNYCSLYRRKVWEKLGGYKSCGYEDWEFWVNAVKHGFKAVRIPQALFYYRVKNTGKLAQDQERDDEHIARIMQMHAKLYTREQLEWAGNAINTNIQYPLHHSDASDNVTRCTRILFVTYGWNESGGGTTFPKSVALELAARSYDVAVFYASLRNDPILPPYSIEKTEENGIKLFGVYNRPALFTDPDNPEREIRDVNILEKFRQSLDEFKPDLVHFHNFHGLTFAIAEETFRRAIPTCFTPHNYHLIDPELYLMNSDLRVWSDVDMLTHSESVKNNPSKIDWYRERIAITRKILNEWVDITLSVSSRQRHLLIQHGGKAERIALVHQANKSTDWLWESELLAHENNRSTHTPLRIGFVGSAIPIKGVHLLVAAAQFFSPDEIEVHIHGPVFGHYLEFLNEIDRKEMITFHGEYDAGDLVQIAKELDLAVVPSVIEDCAPLTLLELQAMRLPVIAASIGGIPDFITEMIDGLLFDPFDLKTLVDTIRTCIDYPSLITKMRRNLAAPTQTFSRYMGHLEKVYATLISRQKLDATAASLTLDPHKARAGGDTVNISWQGGLFANHSLAHVNRELCLQLLDRGYRISFTPSEPDDFPSSVDLRFNQLESIRNKPLENVDITIRHRWPPDFSPPHSGHFVIIQPWEFGSVPKEWIEKFNVLVDELWVPSSYVRECYISSGVDKERVQVVPNGVDTSLFNPDAQPLPLTTRKKFRFLFVGGTIQRKGVDILLGSYYQAFTAAADVCLVIKDMGGATVYEGMTSREVIKRFKDNPGAPEIEYIDRDLSPAEMAGLYTACHCLVHPYRGEGFGLPIAEAMACGLTPIVTGYGAALDFCPPEIAWLIPASVEKLPLKQVGNRETVDYPWLAEPDFYALHDLMRYAAANPEEVSRRGKAACRHIREHFTWEHAARKVEERIGAIMQNPPKRENCSTPESANDTVGVVSPDESALRDRLARDACEKAQTAAQRGDIEKAIALLINQGIKAAPALPAPYIKLAELLVSAKRYEDALQVVPEMPPDTNPALRSEIEAICHAALGNDDVALRAAQQAGERPNALAVLGTLAARQGDQQAAERDFRLAIERDPSCGSAWLSLGMLLWTQGRHEEAWQAVFRAVTVDPLRNDAAAILKDMAVRLGRLPDALRLVGVSAQLYPDSISLAKLRIDLLEENGLQRETLEACLSFLQRFGNDDGILERALALRVAAGPHDLLAEGGMRSISLCMIVRDEEQCLARCLASCKPVVHEMVVVDTGSTDRTRAIAHVFGARVNDFPWNDNFSDARNRAMEQARGAWILVLDADEALSSGDFDSIQRAVSVNEDDRVAWSVLTRNYTRQINAQGWTANDGRYPTEEAADGWKPSWKVRLFSNTPEIRFRGEVHEMVEQSLRESGADMRKAPFVVHHYGELEEDPDRRIAKQRRYYEIGKKKLEACPDDPVALAELAVQAGELGEFEQAIELWNRLLVFMPDDVEALFNKGYCLMGLKRYPEALDVSRRALQLAPDHKEVALNYGMCELYVGDPYRALSLVEPIGTIHPEYPLLQALQVVLLLVCGQPDESERLRQLLLKQGYAINEYIGERCAELRRLGRNEYAEILLLVPRVSSPKRGEFSQNVLQRRSEISD